jgi:sensor histidine kinase YesM
MKITLPRYTSKDYQVLAITLGPITLAINWVIFGMGYFTDWKTLLFATPVTAIVFALDFIMCSRVAVLMKERFPNEIDTGTKVALMITCFMMLTGITLLVLFRGYESLPFLGYTFDPSRFAWAFIGMSIMNIFFTFVHEGIARYESWKANIQETEAVKKVYRQSRLMGLKSQVNPHFLFNSLNSLSCLIQEDQEKGEKFLDEMTRVYRYMLQNDEEQFVSVDTELRFIESYCYILCERHCDGLRIRIEVDEEDRRRLLPPLSLQTLVENIVSQNAVIRDQPLDILIYSEENGRLAVANTVQLRNVEAEPEAEKALQNLVRKYELLGLPEVRINASSTERIITLPLLEKEEVAS